jgi:hypothetical protein
LGVVVRILRLTAYRHIGCHLSSCPFQLPPELGYFFKPLGRAQEELASAWRVCVVSDSSSVLVYNWSASLLTVSVRQHGQPDPIFKGDLCPAEGRSKPSKGQIVRGARSVEVTIEHWARCSASLSCRERLIVPVPHTLGNWKPSKGPMIS